MAGVCGNCAKQRFCRSLIKAETNLDRQAVEMDFQLGYIAVFE
jgi:hypothetical protein